MRDARTAFPLRRLAQLQNQLTAANNQDPLLSSVVKIFTTSVATNYASPWQRRREQKSTGTGFAVDLRQIFPDVDIGENTTCLVTNNHVIRNSTTVRVRRHGVPGKYAARVLCASPEYDLALVAVENKEFWLEMKPLRFAFDLQNDDDSEILPQLGDGVTAVGYPMGGDNISVTRGVVSRIDLMDYTQDNPSSRLLVVQIDAAINPGNSGGKSSRMYYLGLSM